MKRILAVLLALALLIPGIAAAEKEIRANGKNEYRAVIDDAAGLLDAAEYDGLFDTMMPVTDYCNAALYTYQGESTEYVMTKARNWANREFSDFSSGTCTVFIIDMATRQLAVWSSSDVQKTLTQAKCYTITDNVYSYASRKEYARCAETAFNQIGRVFRGEKLSGPMRLISNILLALLAALLLAYLFISARMEQEVKVSLPEIATATAGAGAVIAAKKLTRKVRHTSSSGGGGGFRSGGGGFHGGGGFSGGGGSHGF